MCPLVFQKEPREPIYLYEPTTEGDMYSGPPPGDFQGPPRRGNFRGGGGGRVSWASNFKDEISFSPL